MDEETKLPPAPRAPARQGQTPDEPPPPTDSKNDGGDDARAPSTTTPASQFAVDLARILQEHFEATTEQLLADDQKLAEKIERAVRGALMGVKGDPLRKRRVLRVEDAFFGLHKVNQRDTLAKACCGKRFAKLVFESWKMKKAVYYPMLVLWAVGVVINCVGIIGICSCTYFGLMGLFMTLPLDIAMICLMNKEIATRVAWDFETGINLFLITLATTCYCDMLAEDFARAAAFGIGFPLTMVLVLFNDAQLQGGDSRLILIFGYAVGLVWITTLMLTFQFGVATDIHVRKFNITIPGTDRVVAETDTMATSYTTLLTICFYVGKNIFMKFRYPGSYTVMRARLLSSKETRADLRRMKDDNSRATFIAGFSGSRRNLKSSKKNRSKKKKKSTVAPESKANDDEPSEEQATSAADRLALGLIALLQTHCNVIFDDPKDDTLTDIARIVSGILIRHGIYRRRSSSGSTDDDAKRLRLIIVEPTFAGVQELDSRGTLAKAWFGERFANMAFTTYGLSWLLSLRMVMWVVGLVVNCVGIIGTIPSYFGLVGFFMMAPGQSFNYLMMSKSVARAVLGEFETWIMLLFTIVSTICYCDVLCEDPVRMIAFILAFPFNMGVIIFNDAQMQSSNNRWVMTLGYILALVWCLAIILTFQFGIATNIRTRKIKLSPAGVDLSEIDVLFFANRRLLTICLFITKNAYMKLRYPKAFAVLRARLTSVKTNKVEAQRVLDGMVAGRSRRLTIMDKFTGLLKSRRHLSFNENKRNSDDSQRRIN